jgi:hypothetical protein
MRVRVAGLSRYRQTQMFRFRVSGPGRYRVRIGERQEEQSLSVIDEQRAIQLAAARHAETRGYLTQRDNEASLGTPHQAG